MWVVNWFRLVFGFDMIDIEGLFMVVRFRFSLVSLVVKLVGFRGMDSILFVGMWFINWLCSWIRLM